MRQSKVDKLYAGLKDLAEERRGKLDERHRLFQLNREVDDLEQWIAEREVVAGSHELGQDYEHVTASNTSRTRVGMQHPAGCGRPFAFPVCEQRKHPRLESEVMGFHFSWALLSSSNLEVVVFESLCLLLWSEEVEPCLSLLP